MNELNTLHPIPHTGPPIPDIQYPSPKPRLLIVDDDEGVRTQLKWALNADYEVLTALDRESAHEAFAGARPAVVTLDLGLPPDAGNVGEGFRTLADLVHDDPDVKVVVITGHEEREHALKAVANGAYDYFCKPIDLEELRVILRRAFYVHGLEQEERNVKRISPQEGFGGMLGSSAQVQEVITAICKVATTDAVVLVVGESGTGKELVARAIHAEGARREGPFVAINCGAIPENLLESELFGHEKGAFTGAHVRRHGRIENAQGGTLFLDEINELPFPLQVKLLRFLQDNRIERVGGRESIAVNTRVIAATNQDLKQALTAGRFREDLYYRLNVVTIVVPPLRERDEDVLILADAVLGRCAADYRKKSRGFTETALKAIRRYSWPGNVRELENRIKRAVIMKDKGKITASDLELESVVDENGYRDLQQAREVVEREMIVHALGRNARNLTKVAAALGISRPTLYDLMKKLGISKNSTLV